MDFEFLFKPVEDVDAWLAGLFAGAPLLVALGIAFVLGLRHASDPDHLVAVTSLVATQGGDVRGATILGATWGLGHAGTLLGVGLPLIALKGELPAWLERGAEAAVGAVIVLLAARLVYRWRRPGNTLRVRSRRQAFAIGVLHGLAGTGAVVVLLIAAMPGRLEAAAALAVFAPVSMLSMAMCTSAFAWTLSRRAIAPLYRVVLLPGLGVFGVLFGVWYSGLT
jgi:ABC-type nickel/cobalt efflux system permease component RcnA